MNNSTVPTEEAEFTVDDVCAGQSASDTYWHYRNIGRWYSYLIVELVYAFGIIGNILSLLAFYKQSKVSKSYFHQLSMITSDLISIFVNVCGTVTYVYFDIWDNIGPDSIQKNWAALLYFGWCYAFLEMTSNATLILMNGICLDRIYALYYPMKYGMLPHKARAIGLFILSYILGILTNLHDCFVKQVKYRADKDIYVLFNSMSVRTHPLVLFMGHFQNSYRIALMVSLAVFVIVLVRKYTIVNRASKQLEKNGKASNRPLSEKSLTALMLAQAGLVFQGTTGSIIYLSIVRIGLVPWCRPASLASEQAQAIAVAIQQSVNFLIYIGISEKFRKTVISLFKKSGTGGISGSQGASTMPISSVKTTKETIRRAPWSVPPQSMQQPTEGEPV